MVSMSKLITGFNEHIQAELLFILERKNKQIFHTVDVENSFSVSVVVRYREMLISVCELEKSWCKDHGPPVRLSADLEFFEEYFLDAKNYVGVKN